jgi:hypothetical protein
MNVALAGVVLPGLALTLVATIPYFDRDPTGVGRYFPTAKGKQICIFSALYTTIVEVGLVFWDNTYWGRRNSSRGRTSRHCRWLTQIRRRLSDRGSSQRS